MSGSVSVSKASSAILALAACLSSSLFSQALKDATVRSKAKAAGVDAPKRDSGPVKRPLNHWSGPPIPMGYAKSESIVKSNIVIT